MVVSGGVLKENAPFSFDRQAGPAGGKMIKCGPGMCRQTIIPRIA
jgi:hypothetical protein